MDELDKALFGKFAEMVKRLNSIQGEAEAKKFFSELKRDEYDRLISIFQTNDFTGLQPETKAKMLTVLNKLRLAVI